MEKTRGKGSRFFFFIFRLGILALFALILFANGKKWYDRREQSKEIRAMQEEIVRLKKEGERGQLLLEQLKSPFTIEREGREKLGAKKPGETVVLFPRFDTDNPNATGGGSDAKQSPPFFGKWFQYFFH